MTPDGYEESIDAILTGHPGENPASVLRKIIADGQARAARRREFYELASRQWEEAIKCEIISIKYKRGVARPWVSCKVRLETGEVLTIENPRWVLDARVGKSAFPQVGMAFRVHPQHVELAQKRIWSIECLIRAAPERPVYEPAFDQALGRRIAAEEAATARRREAETLALARVEDARQAKFDAIRARVAACRFDNWRPLPFEEVAYELPPEWRPFRFAGLGYLQISSHAASPPAQVWDTRSGGFQTIERAPVPLRGVHITAPVTQTTLNRSAFIVEPGTLPGSAPNDLCIFVMDDERNIKYIYNTVRSEPASDVGHEDEFARFDMEEKLGRMLPTLHALRLKVTSGGYDTGGPI